MHGGGAHTAGRLYSEQLLDELKIPLCRNWQQVGAALDNGGLAFMPLVDWAPQLQRMIDLRNTLGLRSPIHSLTRILNPLGARCGLQSIFHPGYQAVHRDASGLLGDTAIVVKGDGGEIEINPDADSHLYGTTGGESWDEEWPQLSSQRHVKPATPRSRAFESRVARRRGRQLPANGADLDHGPGLARPRPDPRTSLRNRPAVLGRSGQIDLTDHNRPTFALFYRTYANRLLSNAYRLRSLEHGFVS